MPKIFVIVFTDSFRDGRYQSEPDFCGVSYETVGDALDEVTKQLNSGNIAIGESSKVFILNAVNGETFPYIFEEVPARYICKAV